jgi:RNA polymerase sigma factor (sigma-70 family)
MNPTASRVRSPGDQQFGRAREREVLERLLEGALLGRGGVLLLHGEPGVGKTALLDYAVRAARPFRVARAVGVESDMELAFAALQQMCSPFLELMDRLPPPQRGALKVAFGLSAGRAPDSFLVGLAALGLLAEAAEARPLLCVVDDAQWLDSASARALAFAARRLGAERIAVIFATRELGDALAGLPKLQVEPLGRRDSRALLESVLPAPMDDRVLERIVAETRGNPLALLELARAWSPAQLAGGFGFPAATPLSTSIEEGYARQLARLPDDARRLLLVAAADPVGDPALLWRAAERLGIPKAAAQTAEADGLVVLSPRVVFRHPLVRSAVYGAAGLKEQRRVHQALADATDPDVDPDRRAWHRAQAAAAPDEAVAAELEHSATRAQARGGFAAAAAFLERAFVLTPEPSRRAQRALAAARTTFQAGALDDALGLLEIAESGPVDDLGRAHLHLLRAQIEFTSRRGSGAPRLLLEAARRLERLDVDLARETYLEALSAAMFAGRLATAGAGVVDVARAAMAAPQPLNAPRTSDLLLDGLATLFTEGFGPAVPALRRALRAFGPEMSTAEQLRWLWLATVSAVLLWDDARWEELSAQHVELARTTGALGELPLALNQRAYVHLFAGELTSATSLVEQIQAATDATGSNLAPYAAVGLAALRGREAGAGSLIAGSRADLTSRGEGIGISVLDWAEAVLYNGLGRYEDARAAALRGSEYPNELVSSNWWMVELIEATVRAGTPELAAETHRRLMEMTQASGTDWALGLAARSRALLSDGPVAEDLYQEALARLTSTRVSSDLARAHLLYGEWLRRERRRLDAREQLRTAHELFRASGMEAFAERARVELQATGEHARRRTVDTLDQLTPQETEIARLAAQGETNREIAARLFISASTVEYHLRKAFRKLDIKSRTQLAQFLG